MKFCPECGTKIEGMKFCSECGYKVGAEETNPAPVERLVTPSQPGEEKVLLEFYTHAFGLEGKKKNIAGNVDVSIPQDAYTLTTERLIMEKRGILKSKKEELELYKIKDVSFSQGIKDKVIGIGDIILLTTDESTPKVVLKKIKDPEFVKEEIRRATKESKSKLNISYRQDI